MTLRPFHACLSVIAVLVVSAPATAENPTIHSETQSYFLGAGPVLEPLARMPELYMCADINGEVLLGCRFFQLPELAAGEYDLTITLRDDVFGGRVNFGYIINRPFGSTARCDASKEGFEATPATGSALVRLQEGCSSVAVLLDTGATSGTINVSVDRCETFCRSLP
jgi:hypothetical protein